MALAAAASRRQTESTVVIAEISKSRIGREKPRRPARTCDDAQAGESSNQRSRRALRKYHGFIAPVALV
jgi:hypothetical protein